MPEPYDDSQTPPPPDQEPAQTLPFQPGQYRPLPADQLAQWQTRIARATQKAGLFHDQWDRTLKRYAQAKMEESSDINALLDYRHVTSKTAQLFHRTPEINLLPVEPQDAQIPYDAILPLREKVLNFELGPDRANAKRALHKTLIDTLAASGWMVLKIGFEQVTLPVEQPDPMTGQPQTINVPVWSRRFISTFSSKKLLVPDDFYDTDYDEASFLAYRGEMPVSRARKIGWHIPKDFAGNRSDPETRYTHDLQQGDAGSDPVLAFTEIWYKAALFDDTVYNPELYRCLILVEGLDEPAWHIDSPYQTLDPQGALTDDSMVGSPIHVDAIRDLPDSAYVPSDLAVGEQLSKEVNTFRTELMRNRKKRQPHTFVSAGLGQITIEKIGKNEGPIVLPEDQFDGAGNVRGISVENAATEPRDNFIAQEKAEQDWEQALGISPNQAGNFTRTKRTATEVRAVQGNSSARAETDKDRVREYFMRAVRKFDAIVQRTMTPQELTKILGQQASQVWLQWRQLPGTYGYRIQPDAGQYVDAREYRAQALDEYNLLRKDPAANGVEILKDTIRALGKDAAKLVKGESKPQPKPPAISISFSAEQAMSNPAEMQLMLQMLQQAGYQIDPQNAQMLVQQAQLRQQVQGMLGPGAEHPGGADRTEPVNQHARQTTGAVQGVGVQPPQALQPGMPPMAPPGVQ